MLPLVKELPNAPEGHSVGWIDEVIVAPRLISHFLDLTTSRFNHVVRAGFG